MKDKNEIEELYNQGFFYADIARMMGVSRQRIHQIVKGYSNTGRKNRGIKYRNWGSCEGCGGRAVVLHHKDYDNSNDSLDNLERLCVRCHGKRHTNKQRYGVS